MDLYNIIEKDCCLVHIKGKTKDDVLRQLAEAAEKHEAFREYGKDFIYKQLKEREEQGTTGFGDGVALPHSRIKGAARFIVFIATSKKGVEFDSLDKKKVNLLVTILGPADQMNTHMKILAAISRVLNLSSARNELLSAKTTSVLYENFLRYTQPAEEAPKAKQKMKLIMVILYLDEYLYHILEHFIEQGIDGATVIETFGMGEYISNVPLFASFIGFMNENKNHSKTIMALVPENKVDDILNGIEEITGDMDKKQGAMMMVMDVTMYKGTMKML